MVIWRGLARGAWSVGEKPPHVAYPLFQPELRSIDRASEGARETVLGRLTPTFCLVLSCGGCLESQSNLDLVRIALLLLWQLGIQTDQKGIDCDPATLGR